MFRARVALLLSGDAEVLLERFIQVGLLGYNPGYSPVPAANALRSEGGDEFAITEGGMGRQTGGGQAGVGGGGRHWGPMINVTAEARSALHATFPTGQATVAAAVASLATAANNADLRHLPPSSLEPLAQKRAEARVRGVAAALAGCGWLLATAVQGSGTAPALGKRWGR